MSESEKRIAPFGLRLPPDLKERVQDAAAQSKQSVNSLIAAVLEREFPRPTINLHELAAFLTGLASEAEGDDGDREYVREVNRALATAKTPWTVKFDHGSVKFYPYATRAQDEAADDRGPQVHFNPGDTVRTPDGLTGTILSIDINGTAEVDFGGTDDEDNQASYDAVELKILSRIVSGRGG